MPFRDIFVTLIVFGSLPFILRNPAVGIIMWCWLGLMNPHKLCWGFSRYFNFSDFVAITTIISILLSRGPKKIPWTRETKVLLLFIIWMFITTCFALNPEGAWMEWDKAWKIQVMIFATIMVMGTRERLHALVWITVLSIGFYGVKGGIFTITTGGAHRVLGPEMTFIGVRGGIALALNMTLPLMRYLQLTTQKAWVRRGLAAAMVLTGFAIIGTQSRGAFLGLIAMGVFLILKTRRRIVPTLVAVAVAYSIVSFMPSQWAQRMHTIETYQQDGSAMGRINAWWFAFNLAKDRPVVGGGFETFTPHLFEHYAPNPDDFHDAHSIFFEVLGEQGFIGFFLYLTLMIMAWTTGSWIVRNARDNPETKWMADLASMIQVSFVAYVVGGSFLGLAYFDYYYHLIGILVLCKMMLKKYLAEQEGEVAAQHKHIETTRITLTHA